MRKVLIVDDNTDIQLLLRVFFQKKGFEVKITGDGTGVLALVRDYAPALILMDVMMPGADGIEACSELRQAAITTPIIMLSSRATAEDKERARKAGADNYLLKPFDPAELKEAIRPFLGG